MTRRGVFDLAPALERYNAIQVLDWWDDHLQAWSLLVATAVTARHVENDNPNYLLFERLVMHFVADAVTAPLFWELWKDTENPEAREAYGATLGKQWLCYELLTEYVGEGMIDDAEKWLAAMSRALAAEQLPNRIDKITP